MKEKETRARVSLSRKKSILPKFRLDFKKIVIAVLAVLLISSISVYASSSYGIMKNKYDLVKLLGNGKYLVLFQNNAEARATGGFIGSFAVVEIEYGKIKSFDIESNIYKRDHQYDYVLKRTAPEPLASWLKSENNLYWSMRDANWAIDFPETAKEVEWFYKNEGGTDVDGVVAVNATLVQDLLKDIGPINMSKYNEIITADNFFDVLHNQIEKKYFEKEENKEINEPKTILKDLYAEVFSKITSTDFKDQLVPFILNELDNKEILLYFNNPVFQEIAQAKNWAGQVKNVNSDYLYINNSNLGGLKSSLNISQSVAVDSFINENNERINRLTIIRTHQGKGVWPDADNKNYMRILIPKGSQIQDAKLDKENILAKINLGTEANKTAFGLWYTTKIGQTRILELEYKLPAELNKKSYSLLIQKQPGSIDDDLVVTINNMVKFRGYLSNDLEIK